MMSSIEKEVLRIPVPTTDLVYRNAFALPIKDVTSVPLVGQAATGKPLPLGTVVSALPAGFISTPVGGVESYYCGGNFNREVFQGNQTVYVTAKPE
jgi:hypothetical protein